MDDTQMKARILELYREGDVEAFARAFQEMSSEDVVQEWPQSGERIRGRENVAAVAQNYPAGSGTSPISTLRRVLKPGEAWVIEGTIDYGDGVPVSLVSIIEVGDDGKIARQTDYFANPFEAPAWRSKWVEKMEPVAVG
jgi:SnoaL-like protein